MDSISASLMSDISQVFTACLWVYAMYNLLEPKYKPSFVIFWSLVSVFIFSLTLWFIYDLLWLKPPLYFIWYYISGKLLYTSSTKQIFASAGITYSAIMFVEVLMNFYLVIILKLPAEAYGKGTLFLFMYTAFNLIIFILFKMIIKINNQIFIRYSENEKLSLAIIFSIQTFVFSYMTVFFFAYDKKLMTILYLFFLAILILLDICLLRALKHIAQTTKLKLTNAYLIQEYEQQLSNYLEMKDTEENIRFIRHDLINQIQKEQTFPYDK